MASVLYNAGMDETRDFQSDTFKALLVSSSYTPNKDHVYVSDVSANELVGAGYARVTLSSKTRTVNNTTDRIVYDIADLAFGSIDTGEYARYVIIFKFVTNDADSIVISCHDMGGSIPTNGTAFGVAVDAAGLFYSTQGA